MDEEMKRMLEEEIKIEIQHLSTLEKGSKDHAAAIADLSQLYKLAIEESKNDMDFNEKWERRIMENDQNAIVNTQKESQMREETIKRYADVALNVAGIVLPLIFYSTWMRRGFKFEETGTFTSTTFRGLFNRFRPTK